ncbi:hypothetical protein [Pseudomonas sp. nanlin1]|uniref:hypothetical protein n=1 Tax=Pseudomonas sp. nanlin1 TaxID=3040605 RepID=UPI00388F880C
MVKRKKPLPKTQLETLPPAKLDASEQARLDALKQARLKALAKARQILATQADSEKDLLLDIDGDCRTLAQLPSMGAPSSNIVAITSGLDYCLVRINANLTLDRLYGPNGNGYLLDSYGDQWGVNSATSLMLTHGQTTLLGAYFSFFDGIDLPAAARYNDGGYLNERFADKGKAVIPLPPPALDGATQQAPASTTLAYFFENIDQSTGHGPATLIRLTDEGRLDPQFNQQGFAEVTYRGLALKPRGVVVQADQKLLVYGGTRDLVDGKELAIIARYNADGTQDMRFSGSGYVAIAPFKYFGGLVATDSGGLFAVALSSKGQIGLWQGTARVQPGKPSQDAPEPDCSGINLALPLVVERICALHSQVVDGQTRLLVTGVCQKPNENNVQQPYGFIARFTLDGGLDTSFNGTGYHIAEHKSYYFDLMVEAYSKLTVVGSLSIDNVEFPWLRRFGPNGEGAAPKKDTQEQETSPVPAH